MATARSVEEYLAALPEEQRAALEKLRKVILAAVPNATETISYQIPTVKSDGRSVVAYAAFKDHCSLFPMSMAAIEAHREELKPYVAGRGTIHFQANKPLPTSLTKKLVKARIAENAARQKHRKESRL